MENVAALSSVYGKAVYLVYVCPPSHNIVCIAFLKSKADTDSVAISEVFTLYLKRKE